MESKEDRRQSFRVPVLPGGTFEVALKQLGGVDSYMPTPVNISSTGILVEFAAGKVPDLPRGGTASLQLLHAVGGVIVSATVIRQPSATRFGLQFLHRAKAVDDIVEAEAIRWETASPEDRKAWMEV